MSQSRFDRRFKLSRFVLCVGALSASVWNTRAVAAQNVPLTARSSVNSGARLRIDQNNANELFGLDQQRDIKAIELDLTQAQLRQSPTAWSALSRWVSRGGVVLLHTDAAQLFGFRTVTARERTRERAGQLFGRSRASLPFCANPLLWGGVSQTLEGRGHGALGVTLVYYQLQSGDQLAVSHGAGIPLLSVTDLSAATDKTNEPPLYAAMMAPYGSGWAMVLPRTIEARADGATFSRNLDQFIGDLPNVNNDAWTSVSAGAIDAAQRRAVNGGAIAWDDLASAFNEALQQMPQKQWPSDKLPVIGAYQRPIAATPPAHDSSDTTEENPETTKVQSSAPTPERLLLRRNEATALAQIFARGEAQSGAREILEELAARLAMQRGQAPGSQVPDVAASAPWFSNLVALNSRERRCKAPTDEPELGAKPDAAVSQIQLWNGLFAATAANAFGADAPGRAAAWREAIHWWNLALGQPLEPVEGQMTFVPDPANANEPPAPNFAPKPDKTDRWLGSVPTATIKQWQSIARWEFAKTLHEAPMTLTWQGPNREQNAVNMFPVDAAVEGVKTPIAGNEYPPANSFRWRLVQRTIELLDSGVRDDMGWGADQTEVSLTPVPWLEIDYYYGVVEWSPLMDQMNVTFNGSCVNLWSMPEIGGGGQITGVSPQDFHKRGGYRHDTVDPYDAVYMRRTLQKRLEDEMDHTNQIDTQSKMRSSDTEINYSLESVKRTYSDIFEVYFMLQEQNARTLPNYLTRARRSLLVQSLMQGGTSVPQWLQDGLANEACLSLIDHIKSQGIYPSLPSELQHVHPKGHPSHSEWQQDVVQIAKLYKPQEAFQDNVVKRVHGPSLTKQPSTRQVQIFYDQFGKGAVVETLQRLGAGQNIDAALTATTGLNQSQFFDQWRRWDAAPPATSAPADVATPANVTPSQN